MTEGLPDRVQQLHQRWAADPASRVFLQLAEEYRHLGRTQEALGVLDAGLKEHPGYLSALVAKGRCHLELAQPEAAREALERVVRQDATQMVANKLLVRAYLDTGQVDRARERLDLYSLLHDGDPEIAELRGRIRRMEAPRMDSSSLGAAPPIAARSAEPAPPAQDDDLFGLGSVAPVRPAAAAEEDLFDLGLPAAAQAASPAIPAPLEIAGEGQAPAQATAPDAAYAAQPGAPAKASAAAEEPDLEAERAAEDLFPGLVSRPIRQRYLEGLGAEGLFLPDLEPAPPAAPTSAPVTSRQPASSEAEPFDLDQAVRPAPPAWEPPPPAAPEPPAEPEPFLDLSAAPAGPELFTAGPTAEAPVPPPGELSASLPAFAPAEEPVPAAPQAADLETVAPDIAGLAPAAPQATELETVAPDIARLAAVDLTPDAPAAAAEPATVTLGEIYLRQGHLDEARRIFQEVLRRDPANRAALDGMARATGGWVNGGAATPAGAARPAAPEPASQRRRKIALLNSYLERLRRGSQRDVS